LQGKITLLIYSTVVVEDTTISNNIADGQTSVVTSESTITMTNVTYSLNKVTQRWVGIWISTTTGLTMTDWVFSGNEVGTRAVLDVLQNSHVTMTNCTFSENISAQDSSVMYVSDATSMTVTNSKFIKNKSLNGGNSITLIFSYLISFTGCEFTANQATKESSHIYSIFTTLGITNCTFDDTDRNASFTGTITGGFMYLSTGSTVTITNTRFIQGVAVYGGAIYILGSADVSIESTTFTNNNADQGAAIHATTYSTLSISNNCRFSGNNANSKVGEWLYVTNAFAALVISDSVFLVTDNAIYLKRTDATITSCTFTGDSSATIDPLNEYAGGIEFDEVSTGSIMNSTFRMLHGKGGAFKISSNPYFKNQDGDVSYTITNSSISDCESVDNGGGIYVDTIKSLTLTNTTVTGNSAPSGEGGGIYFICYANVDDECTLNLVNTEVTGNTAMIGGGIKWNYREPIKDSSSSVISNNATLYGTDFAWFAREIKEIGESEYAYYTNNTNDLSLTSDGSESASLERFDFSGVMSGGSIPTTYLALVDQYDQVVTSDDSIMTEFIVDANGNNHNVNLQYS
jgi:predicted outer membrane repeat protein